MRINELMEAIGPSGQLTRDTYNLLTKEIDQFIDWNADAIFDSVGFGKSQSHTQRASVP